MRWDIAGFSFAAYLIGAGIGNTVLTWWQNRGNDD